MKIQNKKCSACGDSKPVDYFYKQKTGKFGVRASCKKCCKDKNADWYSKNSKKDIMAGKRWYENNKDCRQKTIKVWREKNKLKTKEYMLKSLKKYPEKTLARRAVRAALKSGLLNKLPCKICEEVKAEAHHEDYSKPLVVVWLCKKHHAKKHTKGDNL